jgi:hypothetical protein
VFSPEQAAYLSFISCFGGYRGVIGDRFHLSTDSGHKGVLNVPLNVSLNVPLNAVIESSSSMGQSGVRNVLSDSFSCIPEQPVVHKICSDTIVYRRLFKYYDKWVSIGASSFILNIIRVGYFLPFHTIPVKRVFHNNSNCFNHVSFIDKAVQELVDSGAVIQVHSGADLLVISPLNVAVGKKLRLILNLRYLNSHLVVPKFKFEGIPTFVELANTDSFWVSWDIISAYHHVDISTKHQPYLGFCWAKFFLQIPVVTFWVVHSPVGGY